MKRKRRYCAYALSVLQHYGVCILLPRTRTENLFFAALDLKDAICGILYDNAVCGEELTEATKHFLKMADLQMVTEWKRIKKETIGKQKNGDKGYNAWIEVWDAHERYYKEKPDEIE